MLGYFMERKQNTLAIPFFKDFAGFHPVQELAGNGGSKFLVSSKVDWYAG